MYYQVNNWNLAVGNISLDGVTSSSLFIIGDSHEIQLSSLFDTPPESYIVGANNTDSEYQMDGSAND